MILYRFLSQEHALQLLQEKEWKVTRLVDLNDPADCVPTLTAAPVQPTEAAKEAFAREYLSAFYENVGMVCLSSTVSDPVLWSHYADSHKGMAIGYQYPVPASHVHEVKYQEARPALDFNELEKLKKNGEPTNDFVMRVITDAFTRKAPSWSYEKEFRIFSYLRNCTMKGPHYFQKLPLPAQVVLGIRSRITESDIIRIYSKSGIRLQNYQLTRARFDTTRYSLNIPFSAGPPPKSPQHPENSNTAEDNDDASTPLADVSES